MTTTTIKIKEKQMRVYAIDPEERRRIWMRVWDIWKNKKPDPIQVLKKMRREWERKA